jgi:hypothetical protein
MTGFIKKVAFASVLAASVATGASAAIVDNGSFEDGLNGWTVLDGIGTTPGIGITVLTTGGANSTGYGDNVPNKDGTHAAFFVDDNALQSLSQFVSLVGGTQYALNFSLFATESGANNPFGFLLTDSVGLSLLNFNSNLDVPVGVWTDFSYTFTAPVTSNFYLLNFAFVSGKTPAKDVLLDAVSISNAVPEPATWAMMIGGFALAGMAMRRRRTAVSFV